MKDIKIIDIHSHIMPGVDDGAHDEKTSITMLKIAASEGIDEIILTPHNKPGRRNVEAYSMSIIKEKLLKTIENEQLNIKLHLGNEILYRSDISEALESGKALTMCGSRYVLIEFNPMEDFEYIKNGLLTVQSGGYLPILAHAERYRCMTDVFTRAVELVDAGVLLQVNAGSIMGDFGWSTKAYCRKLLRDRLVNFVATDAHDTKKRSPKLCKCYKYIAKKYGDYYADELFYGNATKLLNDEYI